MAIRRVPVLMALVRPTLWYGCDPSALTVLAAVSALVGLGGSFAFGEPLLAPLGLVLFVAGRRLLLWMAEKDPRMVKVYMRASQYDHVYAARSRWDAAPRTPRRWA
ncbi:MAG: hypothetical protein JWN04_5705 [Myxococcaceae bacterium]|nr:hypothetical protein [Myxococcaceae bacterium]